MKKLMFLFAFLICTPQLQADDADSPNPYLRVVRHQGQPVSLDTSIRRYEDTDAGITVDLIGAVHIAEEDYYELLNRQFKNYDVVLYELVAFPGQKPEKNVRLDTNNPLSLLQNTTEDLLGLKGQKEAIDYNAPNFVHADLSPLDLAQRMQDRGDSVTTLVLDTLLQSMRQQNKSGEAPADGTQLHDKQLLSILCEVGLSLNGLSEGGSPTLRRMMASQFENLGDQMATFQGSLGTYLIADRNERCASVLEEQLAKGKRSVAIFYGAAHMQDFDRRMREDFGLKYTKSTWLPAWDLRGQIMIRNHR